VLGVVCEDGLGDGWGDGISGDGSGSARAEASGVVVSPDTARIAPVFEAASV